MEEKEIMLKSLAGEPIEISGIGNLYSPKLKEIINISESLYNTYLSLLIIDKKALEINDNLDATNFEILFAFSVFNKTQNLLADAIKLFFKEDNVKIDLNGFISLGDNDKKRIINNANFDEIQKIIKLQNWVRDKNEEEYNPGNEQARKFIEELKKKKKNLPKPKSIIDLHSIISGVSWKSQSINIFNVWDLTVYQLYDAYYRLENIDNYNNTLRGLYAGTVDNKKINLKNLNWAKIIKF